MPLNLQVQIHRKLQELNKFEPQPQPYTPTQQDEYVGLLVDNLEEAGVNRRSIIVTKNDHGLANFAFSVSGVLLQLDQPDETSLSLSGVRTRWEEIITLPKFPLVKFMSNAIAEVVAQEFHSRKLVFLLNA